MIFECNNNSSLLTVVKKNKVEHKQKHYENIQASLDNHKHLFVLKPHNMRNSQLKELRDRFVTSEYVLFSLFRSSSLFLSPLPLFPSPSSQAWMIHLSPISSAFIASLSLISPSLPSSFLSQSHNKCSFFIGKNRIMARALGTDAASEYKNNLHKMSKVFLSPFCLY